MTKRGLSANKKRDLAFQLLLLAWPVFQFTLFYIVVNLNSFKLAFNFDSSQGDLFVYFKDVLNDTAIFKSAGISVLLFLISHGLSIPLALIFAYYISKKFAGSKFFKVILFLPSIISATVMIAIFFNFINIDLTWLLKENHLMEPSVQLLSKTDASLVNQNYAIIVAFGIFIGFGTTTLIYSNKMSETSTEVLEAAKLDGVNSVQEFFHIILPQVFPTLSTFIVTGVATVFVNQFNLFTFYSSDIGALKPGPLGYLIYNNVQAVTLNPTSGADLMYCRMAALGLICTAVIIPVVFGVKYILEHYGPSEN